MRYITETIGLYFGVLQTVNIPCFKVWLNIGRFRLCFCQFKQNQTESIKNENQNHIKPIQVKLVKLFGF